MKVKAHRLVSFFVALLLAIFFVFSIDNLSVGALLATFFVSFVWFCSDASNNTYLILFLIAFLLSYLEDQLQKRF